MLMAVTANTLKTTDGDQFIYSDVELHGMMVMMLMMREVRKAGRGDVMVTLLYMPTWPAVLHLLAEDRTNAHVASPAPQPDGWNAPG